MDNREFKAVNDAELAQVRRDWERANRINAELREKQATENRRLTIEIEDRDKRVATLTEALRVAEEGLGEIASRRTERRHEATRIIARDTLARVEAIREGT